LSVDEKNAAIDLAAVNVLKYAQGSDEFDTPPIPELRDRAINIATEYNRAFTPAATHHFRIMVRFVDDPSQATGLPPGQVKARIGTVVDAIVTEIDNNEQVTGLPVTATINWLA
ncbi:MAG: hypothetical protein OEQ29_08960, partial [Alphaproteobacteria bacterium]|nr:hypothetical protein [Alphaproteobacteria bacterium]